MAGGGAGGGTASAGGGAMAGGGGAAGGIGSQLLPDGGVQSTNLLQNGDAEAAAGASMPGQLVPIPAWSRSDGGIANVLPYAYGNGYPGAATPGSPTRGANFFYGGEGSTDDRLTQRVTVPAEWLGRVDAATTRVVSSGWFGGFEAQNDSARLTLTFLSASGALLGTLSVGAVTPLERTSMTSLLLRTASSAMPAGTRTIEAVLETSFDEGTSVDGYADDLVVVLQGPPPPPPSGNLLVNGNAEAGEGSLDGVTPVASIPGWVRAPGSPFSVLRYATTAPGFPMATTPGSPTRGANYFFGGTAAMSASLSQVVTLDAALLARVDSGQARYTASGWFGGFEAQNDRATLRLEFLSATDAALGTGEVGGVTDTDRADVTSLLFRTTGGPVPANTRKVRATLESTHDEGMSVDGYADDLFLSVQ